MDKRLLVYNIGCLATPEGSSAKKGEEQGEITIRNNCHILIEGEKIVEIGDNPPGLERAFKDSETLNAQGRLVTPGLVDCHTHLVFGGWRHGELGLKLKGASYLEILASGGGILNSVEKTRQASFDGLFEKAYGLLDECLLYGVTTLEAKSGYGLTTESEIKCLEVMKKLNAEHPVDIVPTFMGAHAVPREHKESRDKFIALVRDETLPLVAEKGLARYCDIFCEKGAFSLDESRLVLSKAKALGMALKIHAEEITSMGGAALAAELGCVSAEHLIKIDETGIQAMSKAGVIAVCLPCTSFYLNEDFAPARQMIQSNVPVAVATDFNPGSNPNLNLQLAMSMACYKYKMLPGEILTAVTLNAAGAIGKGAELGTLEAGKQADILVWDTEDLDYIFYRYGSNLVNTVIKRGNIARRS